MAPVELDQAAAEAALLRWLAALNRPDVVALIGAAVGEEIDIWRHGNYGQRGEIVERFSGLQEVIGWFARCPTGVDFQLAEGPIAASDGAWQAHYKLHMTDFEGGGVWRFRLAPDGRIAWLEHMADELDPRYRLTDQARPARAP